MPVEAEDMDKESRSRLEQFLLGGPLYCNACYEIAPSCDDCGWHIDKEQEEQHHLKSHCGDECDISHEEGTV